MLPKGLGALRIAKPVGVHEIEERAAAVRLDEFRQIRICPAAIAGLLIGAVAVVWPQPVYGP